MTETNESTTAEQQGLPPEVVAALTGTSNTGSGQKNSAGNSSREMRTSKRVKASLRCSVIIEISGQRLSLSGSTEDVSTGGIGWYTYENLPLQHQLAVRVEYQFDGKAECLIARATIVGKVLSGEKFRYSVRFDKVSDEDLDKFGRFINWRIKVSQS